MLLFRTYLPLVVILIIMSLSEQLTQIYCAKNAEVFWKLTTPIMRKQRSITIVGASDDSFEFSSQIVECCSPYALIPIIYYKSELDRDAIFNSTQNYINTMPSQIHAYIYVAETAEFLSLRLKQAALINSNARTVFVLHRGTKEEMTLFLMKTWIEYKMLNAIGILLIEEPLKISENKFFGTPDIEHKFSVSIYDPFIIRDGIRGYVYTMKVDEDNYSKLSEFLLIILKNRLNNVYKYPLRVCVFEYPGITRAVKDANGTIQRFTNIDGELLQTILEKFNFDPVYIFPENGTMYYARNASGYVLGALGIMSRSEADICANIVPIIDQNVGDVMEYLTPVDDVEFWFLTPQMGHSNNLSVSGYFTIFSAGTSLVIACVYFLTGVIWCRMQKFYRRYVVINHGTELFHSTQHIFFTLFGALIAAALQIKFTRSFERCLYMFTVFFATIMCTIYQGSMVKLLSDSKHSLNIHTLKELSETDLKIATVTIFSSLLDTTDGDRIFRILYKKQEILPNPLEGARRVGEDRDTAILLPETMAMILAAGKISPKTGHALLHVIKQGPSKRFRAHMVQKQSPYSEAFNTLITFIRETGLADFWKEKQFFRVRLRANYRVSSIEDMDKMIGFSFHQIRIVFALWFLSCVFCTLVLVAEIVHARYRIRVKGKY